MKSNLHLFFGLSVFFTLILTGLARAGDVSGNIKLLRKNSVGEWEPSNNHSGAVVYLTGFSESPISTKPKVFIDQQNKTFVPRITPITVGEAITFRNLDEIYHNIWSPSQSKIFDLGAFKRPENKKVKFDQPGLINLFCNVHPTMIGYVLVLKNNKYVVTDSTGKFEINNVPVGKQEVRVWVEGADPVEQKVEVTAQSKSRFDFEIKSAPVAKNSKDKKGNPYKGETYNP